MLVMLVGVDGMVTVSYTHLHLVQGTQGVDKLLSPIEAEVFLADGKRIVHRLVETQLEYEDKVLDVLVYVGQVFGNVPGDGPVSYTHLGT